MVSQEDKIKEMLNNYREMMIESYIRGYQTAMSFYAINPYKIKKKHFHKFSNAQEFYFRNLFGYPIEIKEYAECFFSDMKKDNLKDLADEVFE